MRLVAILSNPASTSNQRLMPAIRRYIAGQTGIIHVEIGDIGEITEALQMIARAAPSVLVINGGDGTIQATLSSLVNANPFNGHIPPLAVLPGGKTNMIARDLGMKGAPEKELARLVAYVQSHDIADHCVTRHLIALDMDDGRAPVYGMFFGAAGMVTGIRYCRRHIFPLKLPNVISHVMATGVLVLGALRGPVSERSVVRTAPMKVNLRGGGIIDGYFFLVMVTTLERLIMNIRPKAPQRGAALKFCCIEHRPRAILAALWAVLRGRLGQVTVEGTHFRGAEFIRIETSDPVTLDGEIYEPVPGHTITLDGSKSLTFLQMPS